MGMLRRIKSEDDRMMKKAAAASEKVLVTLQAVQEKMGDWEILESIVTRLQKLITEQEKLGELTLQKAGEIPRRGFDDLDKESKEKLSGLSESQKFIRKELETIEFEIEHGIRSVGKGRKRIMFKNAQARKGTLGIRRGHGDKDGDMRPTAARDRATPR